MRIKHHWTAPEGVQRNKGTDYTYQRRGSELAFPMLTDNSTETTQSTDITRVKFGLWMVNLDTMSERVIEAPFYVEQDYNWLSQYSFRSETIEDGEMIFSLIRRGSYEYEYTLFSFDGATWRQTLLNERVQQIIYKEQKFKVWDTPGNASISPPSLSGGSLVVAHNPLTIAVDYTHAFSYDSGPDTPEAAEYLRTKEKAKRNPAKSKGFGVLSIEEFSDMIAVLPADHPVRTAESQYFRGITVGDDILVKTNSTHAGLESLTLIGL